MSELPSIRIEVASGEGGGGGGTIGVPGPEPDAQAIVAIFARPENAGKGVIQIDGRMVERLHLDQAERLLARVAAATDRGA